MGREEGGFLKFRNKRIYKKKKKKKWSGVYTVHQRAWVQVLVVSVQAIH